MLFKEEIEEVEFICDIKESPYLVIKEVIGKRNSSQTNYLCVRTNLSIFKNDENKWHMVFEYEKITEENTDNYEIGPKLPLTWKEL